VSLVWREELFEQKASEQQLAMRKAGCPPRQQPSV
jgi:hypothetical protein